MNSDANPRSPEEETNSFPSSQDSVQRVLKKYLHGSQESEQSTSASTVGMPSSESSLIYHTANRYEVEEGRARDQVEYSINHRVEFRAAHPQAAFPQSQASQQFSPQMYGSVPPPFSPFFAPVPVPHPPTAVRGVTLFGPNGMPNALNEPKHYGFRVVFGEHQSMSKSATQTYSHKLQKWFVNITSRCTLRIQCDVAPPPGSRVRLAMAHKAATMLGDTVLCCALHQHSQSKETGTENAGHFVRSLDQPCSYLSPDPVTSRHCVLVPIDSMQQSSRGSTAPSSSSSPTEYVAILRFPCYTSHLPRQGRSVQLLCGLEVPQLDQFLPVARAVVEVRVSASPGRDRETAETPKPPRGSRGDVSPKEGGSSPVPNDRRKRGPSSPAVSHDVTVSSVKRSRLSSADSKEAKDTGPFTISTVHRDIYEMLLKIKESLEMTKNYTDLEIRQAAAQGIILPGFSPPSSQDLTHSDCRTVVDWLRSIGMDRYRGVFEQLGVSEIFQLDKVSSEDLTSHDVSEADARHIISNRPLGNSPPVVAMGGDTQPLDSTPSNSPNTPDTQVVNRVEFRYRRTITGDLFRHGNFDCYGNYDNGDDDDIRGFLS